MVYLISFVNCNRPKMKRDILSVADLSAGEVEKLVGSALRLKHSKTPKVLRDKIFALIFEKPSLRTRASFEVAIRQMGGQCFYLSPEEVGLGKREPVADVARVLSRYVHGIIARTFSHHTLEILSRYATVSVINALSDHEHPCQALGDLLTVKEKKGALKGLTLAFVGDGNNVAHSLLLACALSGVNFRIASPPGYEVREGVLKVARNFATDSRTDILLTTEPEEAVKGADVVYTDVWTSMGQESEADKRRKDFARYQVNEKLLSLAKPDAIVMHPMPAHHGEEVATGILDSPRSVVFDQAENRLHIQKALLVHLFGRR